MKYKKIPYPRPDYRDGDLISKEMANGTFADAIIDDVKHFRPVFDRYNVTQDKLTDRSILSRRTSPDAYDINLGDLTLPGIREKAWQPHSIEEKEKKPEIVYNPLKHYSFVEYKPRSETELPVDVIDDITLDIPYYDHKNAGLFGFKSVKDSNGNIVERYAAFCSLKDYSIKLLGKVPDGIEFDTVTLVGYVRGALVVFFEPETYVSFLLDGSVYTLRRKPKKFVNFGDAGSFAIDDGHRTFVYDNRLRRQDVVIKDDDGNPIVTDAFDGSFCSVYTTSATAHTPYPFGIEINGKFFFAKNDEESFKWWRSPLGWRVDIVKKPLWKYSKKLKYDYATDNWLTPRLKTMKYNMIKHGVFVKNNLPCKNKTCQFKSSDIYGDFVVVGDKLFHTYDFKQWEEVESDDARKKFYKMWGRLWVEERSDNISGFLPSIFAITDKKDAFTGKKKMIVKFEGFIFRGGT